MTTRATTTYADEFKDQPTLSKDPGRLCCRRQTGRRRAAEQNYGAVGPHDAPDLNGEERYGLRIWSRRPSPTVVVAF